jgi:hypothetical protein
MKLAGGCLIATALVALASASSASAVTTWYANANANGSTCIQIDQCKTITQAVAKASDGDTIRIAGGDYHESIATAKRLTFDGNGFGHPPFFTDGTTIYGQSTAAALELQNGATVRDLRVVGANTPNPANANDAVIVNAAGTGPALEYTIANVVATAGTSSTSSGTAFTVEGFREMTVHVSDSLFFGRPGDGNVAAIFLPGTSTVALDRVSIDAGGSTNAMLISGVDGATTITNGTIKGATYAGLDIRGGTTSVRGTAIFSKKQGVMVTTNQASTLNVRDSLVLADTTASGATGISIDDQGGPKTANLTGSTIVARGPTPFAGLSMRATNHPVTVHAVDSAFRAISTDVSLAPDVQAIGPVVFDPSHSFYGTAAASSTATLPPPGSGSNVDRDPGFADPAGGDYRLAAGSGLVDRGDPAAVDNGEVDLAGTARSLDGNGDCLAVPDIGAYERPAGNCPGKPSGGSDTTAPVISKARFKPKRLRAGHKGKLLLQLSEKATLTVMVQRRTGKRFRRLATLSKSGGPGPLVVKIGPKVKGKKLKLGRYRLRLTATDASRNRSRESRVSFRVVRP